MELETRLPLQKIMMMMMILLCIEVCVLGQLLVGRPFDSWRGQYIFLLLKGSRPALGGGGVYPDYCAGFYWGIYERGKAAGA